MSLAQPHRGENYQFTGEFRSSFVRNHPHTYGSASTAFPANKRHANNNHRRNYNNSHDFPNEYRQQHNTYGYVEPEALPSFKRRKFSSTNWEGYGTSYNQPPTYGYSPSRSKMAFLPPVAPVASDVDARARPSTSYKRDRARFEEDEDVEFMSRDQIERLSPSRKDGIDALQETHLRYSYCAFLQNLGVRLELPQTTIGTAMVLCHRFFVRRSHASHDRFLIATATLFLAAKSEETPCPLNSVLRASSEIFHKQDFNVLCYLLPVDWFDQYRERVTEAETMVLTTLNFELNVQHPYAHLTSILDKLGLAQSLLVNLALSLVSEGLRSSLWLQFKPHQIAAGAAYLAARSLNMDLTSCQNVWQEFYTPPSVLKDVVQQLMELF
ncbi:Cyclin C/H/T/L [Artemisia annua]|uniref:Cyclin C/H/T/L n=2 Tax=Artemisia annua TaxID=35608 RepID=A0A2U1PVU0_ARTAN|nr:Cyclin C/H/T/L [Artemisia annua]